MDKPVEWNPDKNIILKKERLVSFEDVVAAIDTGNLINDAKHHNLEKYPHQRVFTVIICGYAYEVPYVEDNHKIFLKTIIPSRKAHKQYLKTKKETI